MPTESAMTQTPDPGHDEDQEALQDAAGHDIRRHNDRSIDFDFYRARATALRNEAIRDAFRHARAQFSTPFKQWQMRWRCWRTAVDLLFRVGARTPTS
jgi:hypothetical protein